MLSDNRWLEISNTDSSRITFIFYRNRNIYTIDMSKYLLSTGSTTTLLERYILDLFKLYLRIYPGDIPGLPEMGFDFILTDVKKDEVVREVTRRAESLVSVLRGKFDGNITIEISSIELINEEKISIIINVGNYSDTVDVDLYN